MKTFKTLRLAALLCAALAAPLLASAQAAWPQRPIRLIVPFSAGGPTDVLARAFARNLAESIGQPVVVDNRAGAGGAIGIDAVAKAAPDGYTLGMAHTGTMGINPHLMARHPYDPLTEITPVTPLVAYANVLVVNEKVPARTVAEFVSWAKANPNAATFASGGNGTTNHLSGGVLKLLTGAPLIHVPYKGSGPAMADVVAGNVASMFDIPVTVMPQVKGGRVRPLAILSTRRSSSLPDVPTLGEAGFAGYEEAGSDLWFGIVAPANLPAALLERIHAETIKAAGRPEMQDTIRNMAYEPWTMTPAEFRTFIRNDHAKWAKVVKASGLKTD
jgi:tripartite-type tricarboxylate transporter receptor subunit TctC